MPLLNREVDALWQALCPCFYQLHPVRTIAVFPNPRTQALYQCFSTHPRPQNVHIRKLQDSRRGERGKRAYRFKRARDFFINTGHAKIDTPAQTKNARGTSKLQEIATRWLPDQLKRGRDFFFGSQSTDPVTSGQATDTAQHSKRLQKVSDGGTQAPLGHRPLDRVRCKESSEDVDGSAPKYARLEGSKTKIGASDQEGNNNQDAKKSQRVSDDSLPSSTKKRPMLRSLQRSAKEPNGVDSPAVPEEHGRLSTHRTINGKHPTKDTFYEDLRKAGTAGDYVRVYDVLKTLIQDRGEQPSRRHYQAMLLANTNAQHGSPAEVARILQQMEDDGLTLDSAAYHAIVKVKMGEEACIKIPTDVFRSLQYTLIISSGDKFWKSSGQGGLHSRTRAGKMSSLGCCETSKWKWL